ncbi:hypothetical protein ACH4TV_23115 [Streptomyces sp. NPDC020898]|uniref:hypothetical protein n=1 Tax=Streptomyces sp. NPDC020898 TaxID=3365101 RepID=UPI0037A30B89
MHIERTPDECFAGLSGWPYEPRYGPVGEGLRRHYVDEGPPDGPVDRAAFTPEDFSQAAGAFLHWREQSESPNLTASWAVGSPDRALNQTAHRLTVEEAAACDAPFPSGRYLAGVRQFPRLVSLDAADPPASMLVDAVPGLG